MPRHEPDLTPHDEADLYAAEYVIGLLDDAAHAMARRRVETDPAFARAVRSWEDRLAPLMDEIGPVAARTQLWPRIAAALPGATGARGGLWNSLAFWRGATAVAAAAAVALAVMILPSRSPSPKVDTQPPAPTFATTRMEAENGQVVFVVILDTANRRVVVTPIGEGGAPGHAHELWLLPREGQPISLGVMPSDRSAAMPAIGELHADSMLALSVEPEGGSPSGLPTGPVVAQGRLDAL